MYLIIHRASESRFQAKGLGASGVVLSNCGQICKVGCEGMVSLNYCPP